MSLNNILSINSSPKYSKINLLYSYYYWMEQSAIVFVLETFNRYKDGILTLVEIEKKIFYTFEQIESMFVRWQIAYEKKYVIYSSV